LYGPNRTKGIQDSIGVAIKEGIYYIHCLAMECPSRICEEEGWNLAIVYRLQRVEQDHHEKQLPFTLDR